VERLSAASGIGFHQALHLPSGEGGIQTLADLMLETPMFPHAQNFSPFKRNSNYE
jgi:hypothetical protein